MTTQPDHMLIMPCKLQLHRVVVFALALVLASCASVTPTEPVEWQQHAAAVASLQSWSLSGRLNIRQDRQSDTVNLNWSQNQQQFSIRLSGTLGMGAMHLHGDNEQVILEKAGTEPQTLPALDSLSRDYLDYDFPAAYLLWWVRGLPVPTLPQNSTHNEQGLLQTLQQTSPTGQSYELSFDRYQQTGLVALPGRITLQSQGVTLRFLIDEWELPDSAR